MAYLLAGVAFVGSWLVKRYLKATYKKWSEVENQHRVTGAQTAAAILKDHGIEGVELQQVRGKLTDRYDPSRSQRCPLNSMRVGALSRASNVWDCRTVRNETASRQFFVRPRSPTSLQQRRASRTLRCCSLAAEAGGLSSGYTAFVIGHQETRAVRFGSREVHSPHRHRFVVRAR